MPGRIEAHQPRWPSAARFDLSNEVSTHRQVGGRTLSPTTTTRGTPSEGRKSDARVTERDHRRTLNRPNAGRLVHETNETGLENAGRLVHDADTMNARAVVDRVIDGDTLWVRMRVRLAKSAPEPGTPDGEAATAQTKSVLWRGRRVQLVTHSVDDYGRIVGHLVDDDFNEPIS